MGASEVCVISGLKRNVFEFDEVPEELRDCFEEVYAACGAPKVREVQLERSERADRRKANAEATGRKDGFTPPPAADEVYRRETLGFRASCDCAEAAGYRAGCVLDPFVGSGTTLVVAKRLGLAGVGIDTSADYLEMARNRIAESGHTGERGKQHVAAARAGQGKLFE